MILFWQARRLQAEHARAVRVLRQDIIRINAEKADLAAERVAMIRELDRWKRRATQAEQTIREIGPALCAARDEMRRKTEAARTGAAE